MPLATDLTILQNVKYWAQGNGVSDVWATNSDTMIGIYISQASRAVLSKISRPSLLYTAASETLNGTGGSRIVLKNYPVLSITQLAIGSILVPARPSLVLAAGQGIAGTSPCGVTGYVLEPWDGDPPGRPQALEVVGYRYTRGQLNINVTYNAGYATLLEPATVPQAGPYTVAPLQLQGRWAGDIGIAYANGGAAFTSVGPGGTPTTAGQYAPPANYPASVASPSAAWVPQYTFSAADAGKAVVVSYSWTPADLEYAVNKWVGEWLSYKGRIGQKSKILPQGQGTATFDLSSMPPDVKDICQQYVRQLPL